MIQEFLWISVVDVLQVGKTANPIVSIDQLLSGNQAG